MVMYEKLSYSNISICRQFGPQFTKLILFTDIYLFRTKKLSRNAFTHKKAHAGCRLGVPFIMWVAFII